MSPTWDEYLDQVVEHLAGLERATELGTTPPGPFPTRPTGVLPDSLRDEARRLSEACDQAAARVASRMAVIALRAPHQREVVHQDRPAATYVETDI